VLASYWQADAGFADRWTEPVPRDADVVVIGGGFAGLMTAIRVREQSPSTSVVLLEAERVGFGASGRNAGFLTPLAAPVWLLGAKRDSDQAWAAVRINRETHAIAQWLDEHSIDCEHASAQLGLQAQGRVSESALRELTDAVAHVGLDHQLVESRVHAGQHVLAMAAHTVHPYKLVRGLAEHAVKLGVSIHERAHVKNVGNTITLASGSTVRAQTVIVCTNAYPLDVGERVRALAMFSFMAATEIVEPPVRDGDFTVEVNTSQAYHRIHAGRIIYGGIDNWLEPFQDFSVPHDVQKKLPALMKASFGGTEHPITRMWSGRFHATTNGLPIIRATKANPTVILNVGYGGTGVALTLACARLAAGLALGRQTTRDDARLLATIQDSRIGVLDSVRALGRIGRGVFSR